MNNWFNNWFKDYALAVVILGAIAIASVFLFAGKTITGNQILDGLIGIVIGVAVLLISGLYASRRSDRRWAREVDERLGRFSRKSRA